MGPALETLIILLLSLACAFLLWRDRPGAGLHPALRLLRTFVIVALPLCAFGSAWLNQRGDRLTLRIDEMRIPYSAVAAEAADGRFRDFLVVGDRPENSDLVVLPFADRRRSQDALPPDPRSFVTVQARREKAPPGQPPLMLVRLMLQSFAPDAASEFPGMEVEIDGRPVPAGAAVERAFRQGDSARILLSRLDPEGGRAERRSFTLAFAGGAEPAVALSLSSPLYGDGGSCDVPRLRVAPMQTFGEGQDEYRDPENLVFAGLGAGGQRPVLEPRWLGPVASGSFLCGRSERGFSWPAAVEQDEARLRLLSQRVSLPWYCCMFVLICALAIHALAAPGWRRTTPERVLVPLLQWLLALRMLIAVEGLYEDSNLRPWLVLWDPLAGFLCLPVLAILFLRSPDERLEQLVLAMALLVTAGLVAISVGLGGVSYGSQAFLLCCLTLAACIARFAWSKAEAPSVLIVRGLGRLFPAPVPPKRVRKGAGAATPQDAAPIGSGLAGWYGRAMALPRAFLFAGAIAVALIGLRLLLAVIAFVGGPMISERLFGIPLSLVYVPGLILALAAFLQPAGRVRPGLILAAVTLVVFLGYVVIPFLARDVGILLVSGIPVAAVIAWMGARAVRARGRARIGWAVPAILPLLCVALYGAYIRSSPIPDPIEDLGSYVASVPGWSRNDVRMLTYLDPARVEQVGTKWAFEAMDLQTGLEPLTRDPLGHGWLQRSGIERPILDNQYSDNLSAIHIMWPYGRVGMAGFLLVVMAGVAALRPPPGSSGKAWPELAATMARATFAWAWIYMVAANLNWVPFTGRNLYLLAATSGGDLAEGLVLLLIMTLPFAVAAAPVRRKAK